ncbi:MarR family winged helix-turn-helix transcriptional regulator [Shimia sp. MMG029]|uniref:MarR family winged helix-turn-helix transcriptional regulator n=1 Tax=Shimia sp. MMG029 TaxID=3021978 RepID=UPI0022FE232F|nr:MarR family transcriptional regulator [Shimia sp. MMG029]MDA5557287.1 MarR family transcriptional regulator [Shimia sp. MMG029]
MPEKHPFDLQSFLPYLLNQAAEESSLGFQKVYKDRYGMLRSEWRVLFHLGMFGQMTATEIGARAKLHKTKVSRAVQRLSERRFVRRARSEEDRRVEWLELSPAGQKAYEDLRSVAARYEAELQRKLSSEEVAALKRILPKLVSAGSGA